MYPMGGVSGEKKYACRNAACDDPADFGCAHAAVQSSQHRRGHRGAPQRQPCPAGRRSASGRQYAHDPAPRYFRVARRHNCMGRSTANGDRHERRTAIRRYELAVGESFSNCCIRSSEPTVGKLLSASTIETVSFSPSQYTLKSNDSLKKRSGTSSDPS